MNFQEFKNLVIAACENAGITEYELYYEAGSSINVDTFQHSINEFSSSTVFVVSISNAGIDVEYVSFF